MKSSHTKIEAAVEPVVEQLERRELLAVSANIGKDGTLLVRGTKNADEIVFQLTGKKKLNTLNVEVNGESKAFAYGDVKLITVKAGRGDDSVGVEGKALRRSMSIDGSKGHDTLSGSGRADTIVGGTGNDSLLGGGGSDQLVGAAGNDTLAGGKGTDELLGGDGVDHLNDGAKGTMDGGPGDDMINGKPENGQNPNPNPNPDPDPTPDPNDPQPTPSPLGFHADAQVRVRKALGYVGDNVYNNNGNKQSAETSSNFDAVLFEVKIQNDGSKPDQFWVTGPSRDAKGFRIDYYDTTATGYKGGKNVTGQVSGAGWKTPMLAPGESIEFRVDVTPTALVRGGMVNNTFVTATSVGDDRTFDTVKVTTTSPPKRLVEIRRLNYDASGTYRARIENHGNVVDRMRITGPAGGSGWSVRYFDDHNGGNDITAAVTGGGYLSRELAPKEFQEIRMVIDKGGATRTVRLNAQSNSDTGKKDYDDFVTANPNTFKPPVFPIAVWSQPTYNFAKWKARGVNTLMRWESLSGSVSIDEWTRQANANGLYMVRQPRNDPKQDVNESRLMAWMQRDEPDIYGTSTMKPLYDSVKAAANKPVLANFAGSIVMDWHGSNHQSRQFYEDALKYVDWPSNSIYPVNGWNKPEDLDIGGRAVDRLQKYSDGELQWAIFDTVDQELPWIPASAREPSRGEFRAELWDSIIQGAQGVAYFPFKFSPEFGFDNTSAAIEAEMKLQHPRIQSIGPALLSAIDPPQLGIDHNAPLRATWRQHDGKNYFVVLNFSEQTQNGESIRFYGTGTSGAVNVKGEGRSLSMSGGVIKDDFDPFEVHIYEVDAPGAASAKTASRTKRASVEPSSEYVSVRTSPFSAKSIDADSDDDGVLTKSSRDVL